MTALAPSPSTLAPLAFARRAWKYHDSTAAVSVWWSRCRRYKVTRRRSKFETVTRRGRQVPRTTFHALTADGQYVDRTRPVLRTREAAEAVCQTHAQTLLPCNRPGCPRR